MRTLKSAYVLYICILLGLLPTTANAGLEKGDTVVIHLSPGMCHLRNYGMLYDFVLMKTLGPTIVITDEKAYADLKATTLKNAIYSPRFKKRLLNEESGAYLFHGDGKYERLFDVLSPESVRVYLARSDNKKFYPIDSIVYDDSLLMESRRDLMATHSYGGYSFVLLNENALYKKAAGGNFELTNWPNAAYELVSKQNLKGNGIQKGWKDLKLPPYIGMDLSVLHPQFSENNIIYLVKEYRFYARPKEKDTIQHITEYVIQEDLLNPGRPKILGILNNTVQWANTSYYLSSYIAAKYVNGKYYCALSPKDEKNPSPSTVYSLAECDLKTNKVKVLPNFIYGEFWPAPNNNITRIIKELYSDKYNGKSTVMAATKWVNRFQYLEDAVPQHLPLEADTAPLGTYAHLFFVRDSKGIAHHIIAYKKAAYDYAYDGRSWIPVELAGLKFTSPHTIRYENGRLYCYDQIQLKTLVYDIGY